MKVWITKYALSRTGLFECEAHQAEGFDQGVIEVWRDDRPNGTAMIYPRDLWCETRELAVAAADRMRQEEIGRLANRIIELAAMDFDRLTKDATAEPAATEQT